MSRPETVFRQTQLWAILILFYLATRIKDEDQNNIEYWGVNLFIFYSRRFFLQAALVFSSSALNTSMAHVGPVQHCRQTEGPFRHQANGWHWCWFHLPTKFWILLSKQAWRDLQPMRIWKEQLVAVNHRKERRLTSSSRPLRLRTSIWQTEAFSGHSSSDPSSRQAAMFFEWQVWQKISVPGGSSGFSVVVHVV